MRHPSASARSVTTLAVLILAACNTAPPPPAPTTAEPDAPSAADASPPAAPALIFAAADGTERPWTEASLDAAIGAKRTTVELHSPVYRKTMRYDGFWLTDVLAATAPADAWTGTLGFYCADGFTPTVAIERVAPLKLFLAVRQLDVPGGGRWELLGSTSPAPFYVVGLAPGAYQELPWPFQLQAIRAVDFRRTYPDAYPHGAPADSAALRGFERFRTTCFGCHSINLQGGLIGPELNVPLSVLEYWKRPQLEAFLADPSSVRARSKMPPLGLGPTDIADLLAYLEHMRHNKKPPAD